MVRRMRISKVLITGAAGYIGSVLARLLLNEGYKVVALDRFFFGRRTLPQGCDGIEVVKGDIRWVGKEIMDGVDAVVDLAALSNDPSGDIDPEKTWDINCFGRLRIAKMAKRAGVRRYVLPSSCSVYGCQNGLVTERSSVKPLTVYAKANYQAEQHILPLASEEFCVVVLRQATVYGLSPRMRFDLAINGMVKGCFLTGRVPTLRDGSQWRPFIYVRDVARAIQKVLEAPDEMVNGQIFNVGSEDQNLQILSLAQQIAEALGRPFEVEWYGAPDHRSYRVSFEKIRRVLGFEPKGTPLSAAREIHQALKKGEVDPNDPRAITVKWYRHLLEMHSLLADIVMNGKLL